MNPLTQLANAYNTNKGFYHGYTRFYHNLFQERRLQTSSVLEIGIDQGASLFTWRDYFPQATVYGIDLQIPDAVKNKERIRYGVADQDKAGDLLAVIDSWGSPQFDIILDDGGHHVSQQRVTFETLWKFVKPGGIYVIEDLHTNIPHLFYSHPHLLPPTRLPLYVNEQPTVHEKLVQLMTGEENPFAVPMNEITDVVYFSNVPTQSLSCAIYKKD